MPIYEYQCQGCEHEFETIQRISEAALTTCPSCGKDLLKKKISAVAFRLKGAGWYETDFKSGDKRNVAGRDDASESKTADSSAGDSNASSKDGGAAAAKGSSESTSTASNGGAAKDGAKTTAKPAKETKKDSAKPSAKTESKSAPKE